MTIANVPLPPLYTLNPLGRFSKRAQDYARCRPRYPQAAITAILKGLGTPETLVIADVGAGTGISSRLLADRGATVWAIEPNAAMRSEAAPHPRVTFIAAAAEQTGLPDRSVDLITCCQAFHWFEPSATLQEFHRLLRPTGRLVLMWNDRNLEDPFTANYTRIVRIASDKQFFDRVDRKSSRALAANPHFTNFRTATFTYRQSLDLPSLIGLVQSSSYAPKDGPAYERLLIELTDLFEQWATPTTDGTQAVFLTYNTNLYLANPGLA